MQVHYTCIEHIHIYRVQHIIHVSLFGIETQGEHIREKKSPKNANFIFNLKKKL